MRKYIRVKKICALTLSWVLSTMTISDICHDNMVMAQEISTEITESETLYTEECESETARTYSTESETLYTEECESETVEICTTESESSEIIESSVGSEETQTDETVYSVETETIIYEDIFDSEETSEAYELPGMDDYILSDSQIVSLNKLEENIDEISKMSSGNDYREKELVFRAETYEEALRIAQGYGGVLDSFDYGIGVLLLPDELEVLDALKLAVDYYGDDDKVIVPAWPNYYFYLSDTDYESNEPFLDKSATNYQWHHYAVDTEAAWFNGHKGKGVDIAVIDSGVMTDHEDLNIKAAYNINSNKSPDDQDGHGTHVAGIIGARINGKGGAGIAPEADITSIKVINSQGLAPTSDVLRSINFACELNVDIINMSLGTKAYIADMESVVNDAYNKGILIVAAAGNSCTNCMDYPAGFANCLSVGALQQDNSRAFFSNYGDWVDFSAPGFEIWSCYNKGIDSYYCGNGTSQASPIVAGEAAVILGSDIELMNMSGAARVEALKNKMQQAADSSTTDNAAPVIDLSKIFDKPQEISKPVEPVMSIENNAVIKTEQAELSMNVPNPDLEIYYTLNGKSPVYTNGQPGKDTMLYSGPINIGGKSKVTVCAMSVNKLGENSSVVKHIYSFKPAVSEIRISGTHELLAGKSKKLSAKVLPLTAVNKKIIWQSDSPQNITVNSSGTVKASKYATAGTYKVMAMSAENNDIKSEFEIKISETSTINKISFKKSKLIESIGSEEKVIDLSNQINVIKNGNQPGDANDVSWLSGNEDIAIVQSDGKVRLISAGTVKITAAASDGSGKNAVLTLVVNQNVSEMNLKGSAYLAKGKNIKLIPEIKPANSSCKKFNWSIDKPGCGVTVSNGVVKAASNATDGKYIITASCNDGSNVSASKEIEVINSAIKKISLDTKETNIFRVSGAFNSVTSAIVNADILSNGKTYAYEFVSSNPSIAEVEWNNEGQAVVKATGRKTGSVIITCQALDGSNKKASCRVNVLNPASRMNILMPQGVSNYVTDGSRIKLKAVFEDAYGTVTGKAVTWKCLTPESAKIDKNGVLRPINRINEERKIIIQAVAMDGSGANAQIELIACSAYKKIGLSENINYCTLSAGKAYSYEILFDGFSCGKIKAAKRVGAEVGDSSIISVSVTTYTDKVTLNIRALKAGETYLIVKPLDGSGKSVRYKVRVN